MGELNLKPAGAPRKSGYVSVMTGEEDGATSVQEALIDSFGRLADRIAIDDFGTCLSYAELDDLSAGVAERILDRMGDTERRVALAFGKTRIDVHFVHFFILGALKEINLLFGKRRLHMSIFDTVAANAAVQTIPDPVGRTMEDLYDACIANNLTDPANAVARLSDYFAEPLGQIPADEVWFDQNFPLAKHARDVPGRERSFWKSRVAYNRWRQKVGNRIRHFDGFYDRRAQSAIQETGRLKEMSRE